MLRLWPSARAEAEQLRGVAEEAPVLRAELEAALAAKLAAENATQEQMSEAERRQALLAEANRALEDEAAASAESQREVEALNQQVAELRSQLGSLQALLDAAQDADDNAQVRIEALGSQLNQALARVATEQRRRAELEEAERRRLEAETEQLARFQSQFLRQLSDLLTGREGVRIEGDRFVFSSEVLFQPGSATLSSGGRTQIRRVEQLLSGVANDIPDDIDWVVRVDGHTDDTPLSGFGRYADNWELSQARALSVVRFMTEELGFPPNRLAATGFGQYQPVADDDTPEARARNRRIELKLTER